MMRFKTVRTGLPLILSFAVLAVTATYTWYASRQWRAMLVQADLMRRSLEQGRTDHRETLRAWVAVDNVEVNKLLARNTRTVGFKIQYKNTGSTPALTVKELFFYDVMKVGSWHGLPKEFQEQPHTADSQAIVPSGLIYTADKSIQLDESLFSKIVTKGEQLHIFGYIEYFDIWQQTHRTNFCFYYKEAAGRADFVFCPDGNSAD
jgi:hypothetical protein